MAGTAPRDTAIEPHVQREPAIASAKRVGVFLFSADAPFESPSPLLELRHVSVLRNGREVISDLNLTIGPTERVAIVGPNGSGKSTLLKVLTRECYPVPSPDTVCRIMGQERWNVFTLRTYLGIVSNDLAAAFDPSARAVDTVLSGYFSSLSLDAIHAVTGDMRRSADEALLRLGALHLAEREIGTLSSGEMRRVTIARALVHRPRALVFDEPSTSLDLAAHREVRDAMRFLADQGVGIILVTHDLGDVISHIDRVVLLDGGRIVADGRKETVLTQPALAGLFGVDVELEVRDGRYQAW